MLALTNKISEPLAYIMRWLYSITENYAIALFLFALIVAVICLPLTILTRKNAITKAKMSPELAELKKKFAKPKDAPIASPDKTLEEREAILAADRERQNKYNQAVADVYVKYKYKPWGNGISVFIRYIFIIAVFAVVTSPLTHLCSLPTEVTTEIVEFSTVYNNGDTPTQLQAFEFLRQHFSEFTSSIPEILSYYKTANDLPNLSIFDGYIDMAGIPSLKNPSTLLFFPIAVYSIGLLQSAISKLTESIIKKKQGQKKLNNNKIMAIMNIVSIFISPIILTLFSFKVPPMLSVYYIANTLISIITQTILAFTMPMPYIQATDNSIVDVSSLQSTNETELSQQHNVPTDCIADNQ